MVRGYLPAPGPDDIVYAPIEIAIEISEGLARRGHQVDFYGPSGTRLNVPVRTRGVRALVHDADEFHKLLASVDLLTHYIPGLWDQYLSSEMFKRAAKGEYDLLHFHHPEAAMPFAGLFPTVPVVYTLHDPIPGWLQETFQMFHTPNQFYISISKNQRRPAPELAFASTIYNGIDLGEFPYSRQHDNYLLFVGRIVPEKGVHKAIEVAKKTGHRLVIIGPTYEDKIDYFNTRIKPHLSKQIEYLGFIDHRKLKKHFQHAKALLSPIQWEEPFGLTMVEAMASGTPVIAFNRGSVPEIVADGETGYIVDSLKEMVEAVGKVDKISRRACHERVVECFSNEKMIDGYEAAFKKIIKEMSRPVLPSNLIGLKSQRYVRSKIKKWL
ncbi:MAG: glycosyltransferase family 4 protein [Candidatus Saccharimonadales bacterium]